MTEHVSHTAIMDEKPLSPAARAGLVVNAAVTILLFSLTAILFMAGFTVLALLLLLVTMAAARFGMASFVGRLLQVPVRLIGILGRKLWLPGETTYCVALTPEDAPDLFAIARALSQRSALVPPESISVEMHTNAWVQLRGYRRGAGRPNPRIGFDPLGGPPAREKEGGPPPEKFPPPPVPGRGLPSLKKRLGPPRPVEKQHPCRLGPPPARRALRGLARERARCFGSRRRSAIAPSRRRSILDPPGSARSACGVADRRRPAARQTAGHRAAGRSGSRGGPPDSRDSARRRHSGREGHPAAGPRDAQALSRGGYRRPGSAPRRGGAHRGARPRPDRGHQRIPARYDGDSGGGPRRRRATRPSSPLSRPSAAPGARVRHVVEPASA